MSRLYDIKQNRFCMKAIIEKEYIVDKVVGDIKCGDNVLRDCIGTDRTTLIIRFLSIPIYRNIRILNECQASQEQAEIPAFVTVNPKPFI